MKPTNTELYTVAWRSNRMSQNASAAYWLDVEAAAHLRREIRSDLDEIAALFGLELVEAEPDDEADGWMK